MKTTRRATLVAALLAAALPLAARADEKADALLKKVAEKTRATKNLTADVTLSMTRGAGAGQSIQGTGTVRLQKPNYALITIPTGPLAQTIASDGKNLYTVDARNQYRKAQVGARGTDIGLLWAMPITYFFSPGLESFAPFGSGPEAKTRWMGTQQVEGKTYQVVTISGEKPVTHTLTLYIGPDNLFHRVRVDLKQEQQTARYEAALKNVQTGKPMTPAQFAYKPPAGSTEYKPPERPALLADGTLAPDFTVQDRDGKPVKLSDFRGKVVVLDFWATWCGPCMQSLPHTTAIAKKYQDKNVVVFAVNVWDKKEAFDAWLPKHPEFAALTFAIDTTGEQKDVATALYKVSGIPTQYIINGEGKIVKSFVGFGGPTDDLENAIKAAGGS